MKYLPLAARICLALIFLKASIGHATTFSEFVPFIASKLPLAPVLGVLTIVFQFLGSLSLLLGYKVKIGALLLILFLVPVSLLFHNPTDPEQISYFLNNLGLIGGLLMVIYAGAGAVSLDGVQSHRTYDKAESQG
jgi:putative oxidoreductase